ncbi:MAG: serine/threonine protein kinase, partial [Deltaproteobacteria bacterium]|nr:serine/threonine protein kinase [Deltaproteobacteria bacterium]
MATKPVKSPPLENGTILSGKYELLGVLGRGGMGVVYVGRHLKLGRRVAIKTLTTDAKLDADACVRLEREARAAASLKSRYVASVEDVETLPDGAPYMVMELLEGSPLDAELETRGRLGVGEAVDFILQACSALQEAHRAGIVH